MTTAELIVDYLRDNIPARFGNLMKFAKASGINQAGLHRLLNREENRNLTTETIDKISSAFKFEDSIDLLVAAKQNHLQKKTTRLNANIVNGMSVSAQA